MWGVERWQMTLNVERGTIIWERNGTKGRGMSERYDLEERLLDYAARIIRLVEQLPTTRAGNHVAGQLLRSGTSALPNHAEAQAAESRRDFIHKLRICHKEIKESGRWLRLIRRVPLLPAVEVETLEAESQELSRIFSSSIRTAARNARQES
jgi:four helix bundle protein